MYSEKLYATGELRIVARDPRTFYQVLDEKFISQVEVVQDLAWLLYHELREIPGTHAEHDRLIRRVSKFARYLREVVVPDYDYGEVRSFEVFRWSREVLERCARIMSHYKGSIKRERERILRFIYPWMARALDYVSSVSFYYEYRPRYPIKIECRVDLMVFLEREYPPEHKVAYVISEEREDRMEWRTVSRGEMLSFIEKILVRHHPEWACYGVRDLAKHLAKARLARMRERDPDLSDFPYTFAFAGGNHGEEG